MSDEKDAPRSLPESVDEIENDEVYVIEDMGDDVRMEDVLAEEAPPARSEGPETDELRVEIQELRDANLRLRADFENYRKRLEREKSEHYRFALAGVIRDLLPVLDNFERALASVADPKGDFETGVEMIYRHLADVLGKLGLVPIEKAGVEFDPNVHEGVVRDENRDLPHNTVREILQKGYFLNERLIRPAMVRVAIGGPDRGEAAIPDEPMETESPGAGPDDTGRSEA